MHNIDWLQINKCTEEQKELGSVLKAVRFLVLKPLMLVIKLVKVGIGEKMFEEGL